MKKPLSILFQRSALPRAASVYVLANLASAAVPFLLLPILTRYLTTSEYGVVAMFSVLVGLIGPLIGLNVHGAVQRRFYDQSRESLPVYVANCLLIAAVTSVLVASLLLGFSRPISALANFPASWLWAVVAVSAGQFVMQVRLVIWQAAVKPIQYGLLQIARTLLYFIVCVILVVGLGFGWQGNVIGAVAAATIVGAVSVYLLHKDGWLSFRVERSFVRNALSFGIPLVPHALAGYALVATDRVLLANMVGLSETGVYMVGVQISMGLSLLFTSFNRAYVPWLFERLRRPNPATDLRIVQLTYLYFPAALLLALGTGLLAPAFLGVYVGAEFAGAGRIVLWLALGSAFDGMYLMVTNYIFFAEKTRLLSAATVSAALINLPLTYYLIRVNGAMGAAQATAATMLCKFVFTWWLSARAHPMPWRLGLSAVVPLRRSLRSPVRTAGNVASDLAKQEGGR